MSDLRAFNGAGLLGRLQQLLRSTVAVNKNVNIECTSEKINGHNIVGDDGDNQQPWSILWTKNATSGEMAKSPEVFLDRNANHIVSQVLVVAKSPAVFLVQKKRKIVGEAYM